MPERLNDFLKCYQNPQRKSITIETYTTSDALKSIHVGNYVDPSDAWAPFNTQNQIIKACYDKLDSKLFELKTFLQADLFDSEIDSARYLLKNKFLRASGAICGVILEKHFQSVCDNHGIQIVNKDKTIAVYNDACKDVVYDTIEWRKIQHLGDLRNLCDHNKDREPTKEEVEELINGTDRFIKTIF